MGNTVASNQPVRFQRLDGPDVVISVHSDPDDLAFRVKVIPTRQHQFRRLCVHTVTAEADASREGNQGVSWFGDAHQVAVGIGYQEALLEAERGGL